uniref:Cypmaclein n=1 Tax=Juniperus ashei TaxID=13101 RepID=CMLN_JUNAS|nr:RecName: Full=Cypmaclein; AltName: Allergen=Jun a 7 [Juniperus ashei]
AQIDCDKECNRRCSKASAHDRCLKYCGICCKKCHCVPPGTAGNEDVCPCYANLKNSKGGHKCP